MNFFFFAQWYVYVGSAMANSNYGKVAKTEMRWIVIVAHVGEDDDGFQDFLKVIITRIHQRFLGRGWAVLGRVQALRSHSTSSC